MLDQGFLDNDPSLRFEQQLRAVTAMARQVAGMKLHVAQLSFDEAVEFLMEEAYLEQPVAESEVRRADPQAHECLGQYGPAHNRAIEGRRRRTGGVAEGLP